jgi:hypothetical protein
MQTRVDTPKKRRRDVMALEFVALVSGGFLLLSQLVSAYLASSDGGHRAGIMPPVTLLGQAPTGNCEPSATPNPPCGLSWGVVPSPHQNNEFNKLVSVAAISTSDVWAVGSYDYESEPGRILIEHWDGVRWSIAPVPSPDDGELNAVVATASNDVWAIGDITHTSFNPGDTLTMHWDGSNWSRVPSPNPFKGEHFLYGAAAISSDDVWAVGFSIPSGSETGQTTTMHWDGSQWSVVPSPHLGNEDVLFGVSALSSNDVWAAGEYFTFTGGQGQHTLTMHWDGSQWSVAPSPNPGDQNDEFYSVAAVSANDVWAVGRYNNHFTLHQAPRTRFRETEKTWEAYDPEGSDPDHTLIEHWDGAQWTITPRPNLSNESPLFSVAAHSADDVWAVGMNGTLDVFRTLTMHWDGDQWSVVSTRNLGEVSCEQLLGVAADSRGDTWAVGRSHPCESFYGYRTLTMQYRDPCAPTATPTMTGTPPTATRTWTGTPPTSTSTRTRIPTNTPTPTMCTNNYVYATSTATIEPGITDTGNHGDDAITNITLPFPFRFYERVFTSANLSSNGNLQFDSEDVSYQNSCLPTTHFSYAILPFWDDLRTDQFGACSSYATGCGIFTSVTGTAPNRIFNIEWRAIYFDSRQDAVNFEIRLHEGVPSRLDFVYGHIGWVNGGSSTVGVQQGDGSNGMFTEFSCNAPIFTDGLKIAWDAPPCVLPRKDEGLALSGAERPLIGSTTTSTPCVVSNFTGTIDLCDAVQVGRLVRFGTPASCSLADMCRVADTLPHHYDLYKFTNPTNTEICVTIALNTACGSTEADSIYSAVYLDNFDPSQLCVNFLGGSGSSPDPSGRYFVNIPAGATFFVNVQEVWSDTGCPSYTLTVSGLPSSCPTPTGTPMSTPTLCPMNFSDVLPSDYFYEAVRYLYCRGVISGYSNNTFRPYNNTTRAQLCKIIVLAKGWPIDTSGGPHFTDVPTTHTFYQYIETAYNRGIITGYADGTFRPDNNMTRAQICKIIVLAQQWPIDTTGGPHFTDVLPTDPFYGFVETAYNRGIITGYADSTFRPSNSATRGQICKIVYQAITAP